MVLALTKDGSVCQYDAAVPFPRNLCGLLSTTRLSACQNWSWCCRSISCWALSRYAQWIVERCSDPQQDINAAQLQLDEVLQVLLSDFPSTPFFAPSLLSAPSLPSALSLISALSISSAFTPAPSGVALCPLPLALLSPVPSAFPSAFPCTFPSAFPSALSLLFSVLFHCPFLCLSSLPSLLVTHADMALEHPTSLPSSLMTYLLTHSTYHTRRLPLFPPYMPRAPEVAKKMLKMLLMCMAACRDCYGMFWITTSMFRKQPAAPWPP